MNTDRLSRTALPRLADTLTDPAPMREPNVVHSSHGRLRVHLPYWSGNCGQDIVAAVQRLPGVTDAEANPLTGNVLIRFQPQQTGVAALLEALPALRIEHSAPLGEVGWHTTMPAEPHERYQVGPVAYMTGSGRVVYQALGWTSVGMAVVGAITPGIPTAPFVILGGYFFIRSSPEAHEWLRQSRWFGPILRDWEAHRGVRRSVRNAALGLIGGSMVLTTLMPLSAPLKVTIVACQVVGAGIVLQLRVVDAPSADGGAAVRPEVDIVL